MLLDIGALDYSTAMTQAYPKFFERGDRVKVDLSASFQAAFAYRPWPDKYISVFYNMLLIDYTDVVFNQSRDNLSRATYVPVFGGALGVGLGYRP